LLFNKKTYLLILFQTGLCGALFAQMNWTIYNTENSPLVDNQINCLKINDDKLWVGTNWGLYSYQNDVWEDYSNILPNPKVKCISFNETGDMYVGTISGMVVYSDGTWETYNTSNSILSNQVNDVAFHLNKTYIATIDGLFKIDEEISLVLDTSSLETTFVNVRSLATVGDSLIVGTVNGGLGYLYNDTMIWHNTSNSPINDNTSIDVAVGQNNNVWLAAPYGGLISHLNSGAWINYNTLSIQAWPSNSLNTILIDETNFMFVGSNGAGFFRFYYNSGIPSTNVYNTSNSGLPSNNVLCLLKESENNYWIGTESGLAKWNNSVGINNSNISRFSFNNYVVDKLILSEKRAVNIYSLSGQAVASSTDKKVVDLSHLSSGMYILQTNEEAFRIIKK
jgi:ligand-binding sensor domain-containing protein